MSAHSSGTYETDAVNTSFPQPELSQDEVASLLEAHGVRLTRQRLQVAEVLLRSPCHLTAEQIIESLRRDGEPVSKATVYNTLKVLVDQGLVRQIHLDPDRSVYDSTRATHHHFHDVESGELLDIRPEDIEFSRFPELPAGMEAAGVEVVIRIRRKAGR
ncbi:MAG TPA: Fur family transcriptional regulator [Steroidobacteraceae bacterium]|nr:Fur family transcriptional regulator [Steroidobacteraceae bacterium]